MIELKDIKAAGVDAVVFETYRPQERQNYLYCLGRTVEEAVAKGINKKFAVQYCNPKAGESTWTLNSVHKSCKAIDVVPRIKGKLTWSHTAKEQLIIVKCMARYGFECGTNWTTNRDSCHYQVKGTFTNIFCKGFTTTYVTKVIQKALGIEEDGSWGKQTTKAVNDFRKSMGYKTALGQIGAEAFKALMKSWYD